MYVIGLYSSVLTFWKVYPLRVTFLEVKKSILSRRQLLCFFFTLLLRNGLHIHKKINHYFYWMNDLMISTQSIVNTQSVRYFPILISTYFYFFPNFLAVDRLSRNHSTSVFNLNHTKISSKYYSLEGDHSSNHPNSQLVGSPNFQLVGSTVTTNRIIQFPISGLDLEGRPQEKKKESNWGHSENWTRDLSHPKRESYH